MKVDGNGPKSPSIPSREGGNCVQGIDESFGENGVCGEVGVDGLSGGLV